MGDSLLLLHQATRHSEFLTSRPLIPSKSARHSTGSAYNLVGEAASDSAQKARARHSGSQAKYETVGTTNFQKGLRLSGSEPPFCDGSLLFIKIQIAFMNCPCSSNSISAACPILSPNCTFFRWCSRAVADRNSLVSRSSTCSGSVNRRTSLCCQWTAMCSIPARETNCRRKEKQMWQSG